MIGCHIPLNSKTRVSVLKELELKRMQLLWETNKLSEANVKLYHSEKEQAKMKKEYNKLQLRTQEAMDQLEQGGPQMCAFKLTAYNNEWVSCACKKNWTYS